MPAPIGHAPYNNQGEGGRPTTYTDDMPDKVFEYIEWCKTNPLVIKKTSTRTSDKDGTTITVDDEARPRLPSYAGFARWLNIPRRTIEGWTRDNERFSAAYDALGVEQESILSEAYGSNGNARFAQFLLSAKHGFVEKNATDITSGGLVIGMTINAPNEDAKQDDKGTDAARA